MELPKNGGIVIIDDKIAEAIPLMNALAKRGIAYSYYDGKPRNYPKKPLDSVRIIFLDMHLDEAAGAANGNKNVVSALIGGLDAVVGKENGPYVIMVWSKHDSQHMKDFKEAVLDDNGLQCKPIAILNMEKAKCFETVNAGMENSKEEVEWKLKSGGLEIIEQSLEEQIKSVDSFVLLYNWENGIRDSAKETIKTIGRLFDNNSQKWNENLKASLVRIAKAYAGKTLDLSDKNIIQNAYYSLNSIVNDFNCVEVNQIAKGICEEISVLQIRAGIKGHIIIVELFEGKEYILSYDTKTYCLYENKKLIYENGHIDKLLAAKNNEHDEIKKKLCNIYWDNIGNINSLLNIRNYILDQNRPGNVYKSSDEVKKELCAVHKIDDLMLSMVEGIELEISPICDFAQDKRKRLRILPGLQIPYNLNIHNDSKYTHITIPIIINGECKRLLFDFRYYTSEKLDYFDEKKPLYAIGDGLLQTIKEELSTHGVRSGIVYLE